MSNSYCDPSVRNDLAFISPYCDSTVRLDFVFTFEAKNANPNGDPDAGNAPRTDLNGHGLVTSVAIKRKIRDSAQKRCNAPLYIAHGAVLETLHKELATKCPDFHKGKGEKKDEKSAMAFSNAMREAYYDIRMFGGVLSAVKAYAGKAVLGPVQIGMATSIDPIILCEDSITRCARSNEKEDNTDAEKAAQQFGKKTRTEYGLYVAHGSYCPIFLKDSDGNVKPSVSSEDLLTLFKSIYYMWEDSQSASNKGCVLRNLYVYAHRSPHNDIPSHEIYDRIRYEKRVGVDMPTNFSDYENKSDLSGFKEFTWQDFCTNP